ncbi:MAG: hypothetical protein QOI24_1515 [Acidobacteriota bacterium]|jgi:hypothetical protein|nr:hypothetical protein [Acidobacteriota bacterium]
MHVPLLLLLLAAPVDSTEAAKVASWVRALPAVAADDSHFAVIGGISAVHVGGAANSMIRSQGPAAFFRSTSAVAEARTALQQRALYADKLAAGGIAWHRDVQNLPWGMIETAAGVRNFAVTDTIVQSLDAHDLRYVGTVMPYAGWELRAAGYPAATDSMCTRLLTEDFFYLDYDDRMDRFRDNGAWLRYLDAVVERYDGDGRDDMPGLTHGIRYWQIHNEPEGDHCGLFRADVAAFVDLMRDAYGVVHASCPDCKVLNGGAAFPMWETRPVGGSTFWRDFAAMGGAQYVDVIAVHYNDGKTDGGSIAHFETQIQSMRALLGSNKPVWVTEFGVVVDVGGQFTALTEKDAGAWYLRFYTAGLANGVERFFSDAVSFVRYPDGPILLPFYVNKLLEAKLGGFTSAEKIADGQYRFRVGGADRYVVWNGMPQGVSGAVLVTDMYGNESTVDASAVHPTEASPLIVSTQSARRIRIVRR